MNPNLGNIDWTEISKQLLIFFLGLISGSFLVYMRYRLDLSRDKKMANPEISVHTNTYNRMDIIAYLEGSDYHSLTEEKISKYLVPTGFDVTVVNKGRMPITITGVYLEYLSKGKMLYTFGFHKTTSGNLPVRLEVGDAFFLQGNDNLLFELPEHYDENRTNLWKMIVENCDDADVYVTDAELNRFYTTVYNKE